MFFEQHELVVKEMARKEIIKRDWLLNPGYNIFYKIKGEPKERTEDYIIGDFDLFDHEKEWKIKQINDFKFVFKTNE